MKNGLSLTKQRTRSGRLIAYPILFAILFLALSLRPPIDNDTYWLIALGRSIANNGIPTVEPLAMHEGLNYVAQQWLSALCFNFLYSAGGSLLLAVFCRMVMAFAGILVLKYCSMIARKDLAPTDKTPISAYFMAALIFFALNSGYGTARPSIFTITILFSELIILEYYAQTGKIKPLLLIPVLSLLLINLHASMWLMIFVFAAPYIAESIYEKATRNKLSVIRAKTGISARNIQLLPIALSLFGAGAIGFLNPYGAKQMTYLFTSYGIDTINDNIKEMSALSFESCPRYVVYILVAILVFGMFKKRMPLAYICLFAGTTLFAFTAVKCYMYFLIGALPILAFNLNSVHPPKFSEQQSEKMQKTTLAVCLCTALIVTCAKDLISIYSPYSRLFGIQEATEFMKSDRVITSETIYADFNCGGYLEFEGYKPYIDARAEVFLAENNGVYDYLSESFSVIQQLSAVKPFLEKYDFDVLFVSNLSALSYYLENSGQTEYAKAYDGKNNIDRNGIYTDVWYKTNTQNKGEMTNG